MKRVQTTKQRVITVKQKEQNILTNMPNEEKLDYFLISLDNVKIERDNEKNIIGCIATVIIKSNLSYDEKDWENLSRLDYARKYNKQLAELAKKYIKKNRDVNAYHINTDDLVLFQSYSLIDKNILYFKYKLKHKITNQKENVFDNTYIGFDEAELQESERTLGMFNNSLEKEVEPKVVSKELQSPSGKVQETKMKPIDLKNEKIAKSKVKKQEQKVTEAEDKEVQEEIKRYKAVKEKAFANFDKNERLRGLGIDRVLLIKQEWGEAILDGNKVWEIRNKPCKFRGRFGLAYNGTGKCFGTVELTDSFELTKELYEKNFKKHLVNCKYEDLPEAYKYVWVLERPKKFVEAIEFERKRGAQVWQQLT